MDYPGSIPDNIHLLLILELLLGDWLSPREAVREEPIRLESALGGKERGYY